MSFPQTADSSVHPEKFGLAWNANDSLAIQAAVRNHLDSALAIHNYNANDVFYQIESVHPFSKRTADFYLLVTLVIILGLIRYSDRRYFKMLTEIFYGGYADGQKSKLMQVAVWQNMGMNLFFCIVAGTYLYYLSVGNPLVSVGFSHAIVLIGLIGGTILIYSGKDLILRFLGWLFRVETLANEYLFNVFLVNKVLGIALLPFIILLAFGDPQWFGTVLFFSGAVAIALFIVRYLKSWSLFYPFFKGSKFHFFIYLCASEILPLAVLIKWLLHLLR